MNQRIVFIAAALLVSPLLVHAEDGRKSTQSATKIDFHLAS